MYVELVDSVMASNHRCCCKERKQTECGPHQVSATRLKLVPGPFDNLESITTGSYARCYWFDTLHCLVYVLFFLGWGSRAIKVWGSEGAYVHVYVYGWTTVGSYEGRKEVKTLIPPTRSSRLPHRGAVEYFLSSVKDWISWDIIMHKSCLTTKLFKNIVNLLIYFN